MIRYPCFRAEVSEVLNCSRAVAFISVEWSGHERQSRPVFAELVRQLTEQHPALRISFFMLRADWEGITDWFAACNPPVQAATGYGAVVWLEKGQVVAAEEYAARAGAGRLVQRTLQLWG